LARAVLTSSFNAKGKAETEAFIKVEAGWVIGIATRVLDLGVLTLIDLLIAGVTAAVVVAFTSGVKLNFWVVESVGTGSGVSVAWAWVVMLKLRANAMPSASVLVFVLIVSFVPYEGSFLKIDWSIIS
jgi:hypothetical protein